MKIYFPIAKVDADRREVWGYASTEARDDQGEIVKREALIAAVGEYMKFANIREMHQLSAVGVAKEAAVDDKGLYIGARIVDDQAWQKVIEGVYKGYSIGGRVTARDPADFKTITGLVLNEISLVDRPANPEAIFDYWKSSGTRQISEKQCEPTAQMWTHDEPERKNSGKSEPVLRYDQARRSGSDLIAAARSAIASAEGALQKARAEPRDKPPHDAEEYADPGYQGDGKKRYPVDTAAHIRAAWFLINRPSNAGRYTPAQLAQIKTRIISAWKEKIDRAGPPGAEVPDKDAPASANIALTKALWDVGHIARIILDLNWLQESLTVEAAVECDDSPQPERLQAIIAELCVFLNALVAEETAELVDEMDAGGEMDEAEAADLLVMAAGSQAAGSIATTCERGSGRMQKLAAALRAKARHRATDQTLLNLAHHAVDKCMGMSGLLSVERRHLAAAREALEAAGARPPGLDDYLDIPDAAVLEPVAAVTGKRGQDHQDLMDIAHDCVGKLTDGDCCVATKAGARHSRETIDHLKTAHDHLVRAGAQCAGAELAPGMQRPRGDYSTKKVAAGDLAKMLADERAEKVALMTTLTDIVPRLDQLSKRVEDIARTPLPPLAMTRNITAISKQQDGGSRFSADELASAFAQMSKEEQTLTLIKASYSRPIHPPGLPPAKDMRSE